LFGRPLRRPVDAGQRVIGTLLSGTILYGMNRMQRCAVWNCLLLTAMDAAIAVAIFGLGAWRGLLAGCILRMAIVVPSLSYWKRWS